MNSNTQRSVEDIANELADKIHACYQGADLVQNQYAELIAEAILFERQEADKLRTRLNDLTGLIDAIKSGKEKGTITIDRSAFRELYKDEIGKLRQENEALKAQVSGLVGAIQGAIGISDLWVPVVASEEDRHEVEALHDMQSEFKRVLSILPSQYLEIAKAKDAVIEAAKRYRSISSEFLEVNMPLEECQLMAKALRTLQQAQEKP